MEIELLPVYPDKLTREDWDVYHEYRKKRHMETRPEDPMIDDASAEKSLIVQFNNPEIDPTVFSIIEAGKPGNMIGDFAFITFKESSIQFENNKHLAVFDLALLPEYRQKGIGKKILADVYKYAIEKEKAVLISSSNETDGRAFLKAIGAQEALEGVENRLQIDDVDWSLIKSWNEEGPLRSKETKMEFFDKVPEEIIKPFSEFFTEVANQAPMDDLDINDIIFTPETIRQNESDLQKMGVIYKCAITV